MKKQPKSLSMVRSSLIRKGLLYSPEVNKVQFTVPGFEEFIKRSPEIIES